MPMNQIREGSSTNMLESERQIVRKPASCTAAHPALQMSRGLGKGSTTWCADGNHWIKEIFHLSTSTWYNGFLICRRHRARREHLNHLGVSGRIHAVWNLRHHDHGCVHLSIGAICTSRRVGATIIISIGMHTIIGPLVQYLMIVVQSLDRISVFN